MPALVVPAVATTAMTSSARGCPSQGGPQRQAGQAVVLGRDDERLDADDVEGLAHRGVGVLTHRDQRTGGSDPAAPVAGRVAGHHEGREVPGRATGHEAPPGPGGQAGRPGDDLEGLVLGDHDAGRLQPRGPVQRGARDEHVEEERGLGRGGRDERQEAGAVARHHRRGQLVDEQPHDLGGLVPLGSHQPGQRRSPDPGPGRRSRAAPGRVPDAPCSRPPPGRSWPRRSGTSPPTSCRRRAVAIGRIAESRRLARAATPLRPGRPPRAPAPRSPRRSARRPRTRAWPARSRPSCAPPCHRCVTSSKLRAAGHRSVARGPHAEGAGRGVDDLAQARPGGRRR